MVYLRMILFRAHDCLHHSVIHGLTRP